MSSDRSSVFIRRVAAAGLAASLLAGAAGAKECPASETARNKAMILAFAADAANGASDIQQRAEKFMTPRYIQHHPGVASGRQPFIDYHVQWYKTHPQTPGKPEKLAAVVAECDMVMIMHDRLHADPDHPGQSYHVFDFDLWRIKDGKADEHWDAATEMWKPPAAGQ
jgi:predicted SnoaL-like aldol condensation-catalyzing enzyme